MSNKLRLFLLYSFPAALFCSYYPLIPLASTASTNYELSLALIWLFLFSVLSIKDFLKSLKTFKSPRPYLLFLFPLYLSLSALWSSNPLRAVLTSGILWCLYLSAFGILKLAQSKALNKQKFLKLFLLSSCVFSAFCWLQSLLDVLSVGREITLLCPGCTSYSFGFPHPSGFAIEPQFMGNLLLAPTLTSLFLLAKPKTSTQTFNRKSLLAISFFLTSTLFLTFSRGAIYSFILAASILIIVGYHKTKHRTWLTAIPLVVISFLFTLFMQGLFSAASYTNTTFVSGIENSISQLSLGKIELGLSKSPDAAPSAESETATSDFSSSAPVFDGYVEESTNTRMKFNRIALELSPKNAKTLLFGYGLGSAGEIMFKEGKTTTPYEIVQNEPLSLLLETGLVGLALAALSLALVLSHLKKLNRPERYLLGAVIISFLFSLLFFSGLPNALHIYLFPVFLFATLRPNRSSRQTQTYHTPRN